MALDDFLLEAEEKMSKTEQVVINEFAGVRTGKASPALVENILVEVYGSHMRIRELAGITTPEARTLTIQPWDVNSLHPIEKAIQKSNLGLTPSVQGKSIRIFFPGTEHGTAAGVCQNHQENGGGRARCGSTCSSRRDGSVEKTFPR